MKRNLLVVHFLALFVFSYSSAIGQSHSPHRTAQQSSLKAPTSTVKQRKLTSYAKKYLKEMEKSRNHPVRSRVNTNTSSARRNQKTLTSYLKPKETQPKNKDK